MVGFRHLLLAVLFHVAVIALLTVGVQCSEKIEPPPAIVAVVVSDLPKGPKSKRPMSAPKPTPEITQEAPPDPGATIDEQSVRREQEREREQQRLRDERRAAEEQQRAEAEQRRQQEEAERREQAELALERAEAEKAKREAEEEARNKAAEAEADKNAEEEARKKAEAERKRKEDEQRRAAEQRRRQQELAQMIAAEEEAEYISGVQRTWADDIRDAIRSQWLRPPGLSDELRCRVRVELLPSGQIISVRIAAPSGVVAFDDSVEKAIAKADPLPTPTDPKAFERVLELTFTPKYFD